MLMAISYDLRTSCGPKGISGLSATRSGKKGLDAMLVPARMLSGGGASTGLFRFLWLGCGSVPHGCENQYRNKNLPSFHRSLLVRRCRIAMDQAADCDWAFRNSSNPIKLLSKCGACSSLCTRIMPAAREPKLFRVFVLCSRSLAFYRHLKRPTQHVVVGNCVLSD